MGLVNHDIDAIRLHNELSVKLGNEITNEQFGNLKQQLRHLIGPGVLENLSTVPQLLNCMEDYEIISIGSYGELKRMLEVAGVARLAGFFESGEAPLQKEPEAEIRVSLKKLKLDIKGDERIIATLAKAIFGCLACYEEAGYDETADISSDQHPMGESCFHTVNKLKIIEELELRKVEINCTSCGAALDYSEVRKKAGFSPEEKMKVEILLNENYLSRNSLFNKCPECKTIAMREDQNNLRVRCVICPKFEFCWQCLRAWPDGEPITSGEQCGHSDCKERKTKYQRSVHV